MMMKGLIDSIAITLEGDEAKIAEHNNNLAIWKKKADEENVAHIKEFFDNVKTEREQ